MKTSTLVQSISDLLVTDLSMVEAESPDLENSTIAGKGTTATRFWIDCQSQDSDLQRQRTLIRKEHNVTISFLIQPKIRQQFDSMKSAMDLEGKIIDTLMEQSNLVGVRVLWESTSRQVLVEGKMIKFDIAFNMQTQYTIGESLTT